MAAKDGKAMERLNLPLDAIIKLDKQQTGQPRAQKKVVKKPPQNISKAIRSPAGGVQKRAPQKNAPLAQPVKVQKPAAAKDTKSLQASDLTNMSLDAIIAKQRKDTIHKPQALKPNKPNQNNSQTQHKPQQFKATGGQVPQKPQQFKGTGGQVQQNQRPKSFQQAALVNKRTQGFVKPGQGNRGTVAQFTKKAHKAAQQATAGLPGKRAAGPYAVNKRPMKRDSPGNVMARHSVQGMRQMHGMGTYPAGGVTGHHGANRIRILGRPADASITLAKPSLQDFLAGQEHMLDYGAAHYAGQMGGQMGGQLVNYRALQAGDGMGVAGGMASALMAGRQQYGQQYEYYEPDYEPIQRNTLVAPAQLQPKKQPQQQQQQQSMGLSERFKRYQDVMPPVEEDYPIAATGAAGGYRSAAVAADPDGYTEEDDAYAEPAPRYPASVARQSGYAPAAAAAAAPRAAATTAYATTAGTAQQRYAASAPQAAARRGYASTAAVVDEEVAGNYGDHYY